MINSKASTIFGLLLALLGLAIIGYGRMTTSNFLTFLFWGAPLVFHGLVIVGLNFLKDIKFHHSMAGVIGQGGSYKVFTLSTVFYLIVAGFLLAINFLVVNFLSTAGLIFAVIVIFVDLHTIISNADDYALQRSEDYYEDKYS